MPFTFAHPAIVLPGVYLPPQWVSLTGLVAGSLAPDFEYFLRWQVLSQYSHTLPGIFWLDLPLALGIAMVYHLLIKKTLLENLPLYLKGKLFKFKNFNWVTYFQEHFLVVLLSSLAGILSHIGWDSFTHPHGFMVKQITFLSNPITVNQISIPVYKLLQHGSSLLGLLLIGLTINKLPVHKTLKNPHQVSYWLTVTFFICLFIGMRFLFGLEFKQYGNVVVTVISAGLLSLSITPFFLNQVLPKNIPDNY
ncbi:DUF4184 family protein [Adhaeribacter pallidiroseus]|uniref:DUF4184 family protein n=1 Tax=Adhaeribacter pallidiroseus TaxID=2072847 RepID=A0A369QH57_9BACT|nr:DUF4184 family protein [Adhaeribacter pallidiroseus]RDC64064.1 hypothetical protein AHMF7616_02674 [Adhaeribacter pallidiroseus]